MNSTRRREPLELDGEFDLVGRYLRQIAATPLLTADDEVELAERIEVGLYAGESVRQATLGEVGLSRRHREELAWLVHDGAAAKDRMTRANLRLVVAAARKYSRVGGAPFLDVVQDGNLGLIRAVEKFDFAKGYKFSTYAMWWIRQSIERGIANKARTIRLPVDVIESLSRLARVERTLQVELGREPTTAELATRVGLPVKKVEDLRRVSQDVVSLDTPIGGGEARVGDLIEDREILQATDVVEFRALAEEMRALVGELPPREAMIISLRYGLHDGREHTMREIAARLGLSRERVRQLERRAMRQLKRPELHDPLLAWAS